MSKTLSQSVMLAMSIHAMPGVYAVLAGSGLSTSAGVLTGWGVTKDLVRQLAAAEHPGDETQVQAATENPEQWWAEHHDGALGYSNLLDALAPTPAARQGMLARYFTPADEDREQGLKVPGAAHRGIAELVRRGSVRVLLTTNFDRLIEKALEVAGVSAQVISRPEAVKGMAPLVHAEATVIKLHGDYMDLGSLNTPSELSSYPDEWNRLLEQVFDEYGLVVSGWSADWDIALSAAIRHSPNRRYPLFWDSRSSKGVTAMNLLKDRGGRVITAGGADEMFSDLVESLEALDRLSEPPISTAMAIARLKRYLLDPTRRIDLDDLVIGYTSSVADAIADQPLESATSPAFMEQIWDDYLTAATPLLRLLVEGIWLDTDGLHDQLWIDVLQRLVDAGASDLQQWSPPLRETRLVPALLMLAVAGIVAARRGRETLFMRMTTEVEGNFPGGYGLTSPAGQLLHPASLMQDWAQTLPRWNGAKPWFPWSKMLKADLRFLFEDRIPGQEYDQAFYGFEYRLGLIQQRQQDAPAPYRAVAGEYIGETGWSWDDRNIPNVEVVFRKQATQRSDWPWNAYLGDFDTALVEHREILQRLRTSFR